MMYPAPQAAVPGKIPQEAWETVISAAYATAGRMTGDAYPC